MHPNWAEVVTAIATAVSALGLIGVLAAAASARTQVRAAVRTHRSHAVMEIFRVWNSEELIETRAWTDFLGPEALKEEILELWNSDGLAYLRALRPLNFCNP